MAAASQIASEVMREVLSDHERNLLRMAGNGKSLSAIALLHRQYEGENGVKDALDAIRSKVEEAVARRVNPEPVREEPAPIEDAAIEAAGVDPLDDDERSRATEVRSVPAESMSGADAGQAPDREDGTPPIGSASAHAAPSPSELDTGRESPARNSTSAREAASLRRDRIVVLLESEPMSAKRIAAELDESPTRVFSALERLEHERRVIRDTRQVFDWPGAKAGSGHPSRLWRLRSEDDEPAEPEPFPAGSNGNGHAASNGNGIVPATVPTPGTSDHAALVEWLRAVDADAIRMEVEALRERVQALEGLLAAVERVDALDV